MVDHEHQLNIAMTGADICNKQIQFNSIHQFIAFVWISKDQFQMIELPVSLNPRKPNQPVRNSNPQFRKILYKMRYPLQNHVSFNWDVRRRCCRGRENQNTGAVAAAAAAALLPLLIHLRQFSHMNTIIRVPGSICLIWTFQKNNKKTQTATNVYKPWSNE